MFTPGNRHSSGDFLFLIPFLVSAIFTPFLSVSRRPESSIAPTESNLPEEGGRKLQLPGGVAGSALDGAQCRSGAEVPRSFPRVRPGASALQVPWRLAREWGRAGEGGAGRGREREPRAGWRAGGPAEAGVGDREAMEGRSGGMGEGKGREAGGGAEPELELKPEPAAAVEAVMSVQVVSAAAAAKVPEVDLKDLSPPEAEPPLGLSAAAVSAMAPPAGGGDPEAPAPAAERPPAPGPGSGPAAALSPAAGKVPQASAMKRSDPHHQHQRHRDGGEALLSPDGTVTEAPRTVKKVLGPGCLSGRERAGGEPHADPVGTAAPSPRPPCRAQTQRDPSPVTPLAEMPSPGPRAGERGLQPARSRFPMDNMEVALSTPAGHGHGKRRLMPPLPAPQHPRGSSFSFSGEKTPMVQKNSTAYERSPSQAGGEGCADGS